MSFIIRNKTGAGAQLPTVNVTVDVADEGTADLLAIQPNGLPLNYSTDLYRDGALVQAVGAGDWVVVRNSVELTTSEGLQALTAAGAEATSQEYANTLYVDPSGKASNTGLNPAQPTTLTAALAAAVFSTNIILAEGTYADAPTIPQNNITLTARQGGTQSNSVIVSGLVTLGPGRTRFRAYGVRFDGGFADSSDGRHYFSACSAGGGTYVRTNPANFMVWKNCDFSAMPYTATGAGASTLVVEGAATVLSTITSAPTASVVEIHEATAGRITMSGGLLILDSARVQDATLAVDASASTTVRVFQSRLTTLLGAPAPITAAGSYWLNDAIYEPAGSTLGTPVGTPAAFSADLRYPPATPGDYAPAVDKVFAALDQLAARPAATLFGGQSQVFSETVPTTVNGLTLVPILPASSSPPVNTTALEQGTYRVKWTAALRPTSGVGRVGAQMLIDSGSGFVAVGVLDSVQAGTGGGVPVTTPSATFDVVQPSATPTVWGLRIDAAEYSTGTWTNVDTRIEIWRLS